MKRSRNYPRLRHGGYLWRWLDAYWIWKPEPAAFFGAASVLVTLATPRHWIAFAIEMAGASLVAWVLGWRHARPEDFEL